MEKQSVKTKIFFLPFIWILVAGCSDRNLISTPTEIHQTQITQITVEGNSRFTPTLVNQKVTQNSQDHHSQTPAIIQEASNTLSSTKILPTNTIMPIRSCKNNGFPDASPNDLELFGEVLLVPWGQEKINVVNLETQAVSIIYNDEMNDVELFGLSPNENWLVYAVLSYKPNGYIDDEFKLELISETGERIEHQMNISQFKDLFLGDEFVGFGTRNWINNELIYTTLLIQNPFMYGSKTYGAVPVILNPLAGSWEDNLLQLQPEWNRKTEIGFSPDLQHVILQGNLEIKLKDIKNEKYLWHSDDFLLDLPDSKIRWSPNGKFVAVGKRFLDPRILLVSADGGNSVTIPMEKIGGFLDFEWSPNSELLMMYHSNGNEEKQFHLYDVGKHQIVLKCPVQQPWDILFQWSPDSNQIIYGTDEGYLMILDIPSGVVAKLDVEDMFPFSWTNKQFSR